MELTVLYSSSSLTTRLLWPIAIAIVLLVISPELRAGVVDRIERVEGSDPPEVKVLFNIPLQIINYAPLTASDDLAIQLRPVVITPFVTESMVEPVITGTPSKDTPILDITYRAVSVNRSVLDIRFTRTVNYTVRQGDDLRSLILSVTPIEAGPSSIDTQASGSVDAPARDNGQSALESMPDYGFDTPYVINLESAIKPLAAPPPEVLRSYEQYIIYPMSYEIDGAIWHQLRLGFFKTQQDAQKVLPAIKKMFPRALITQASNGEIGIALNERGETIRSRTTTVTAETVSAPDTAQPPVQHAATHLPSPVIQRDSVPPIRERTSSDHLAELMEEARQMMASENYTRAIQLYTKILEYPDHSYRQDAQEYLALARERKGQLAHAKAEYERYLKLYPDGEGAERVRQRLAGLLTARKQPVASRKARSTTRTAQAWDVFGGFSQFYRRAMSVTDEDGNDVNASALSSDIDISGRRRGTRYDFQARLTGSYSHDFLGDGPGSDTSVSTLYIDGADRTRGLDFRLGRQSRNTGGVLGRFDGLLLGYKLTDWMTINTVTGFPVESTDNNIDTDRKLYGLSVDWGTFSDAWDFNTFIIEQKADSITDRRGVGGEIRYFDSVRSLLAFVDYDISYNDLNTLILLGTWILPAGTTINASMDYRNSPVLTTTNALQNQTVKSISELENLFTESEIRQLAEDRTADVKTVAGGISHPFTDHSQISADITATTLSATVESGNVEAVPGTGWEYFYNLQFIGSGLIRAGDISVIGLRYTDGDNANTSTLTLNSRYPVNRNWRVNPRLRLDYRDNDDGTTQWITAPAIRTDYRWQKRYRFEFEAGAEWLSQKLDEENSDTSSYFLSLGYRYDF